MSPLGYRRSTPSSTLAVDSGMHRAVPDGRAARGTLRALALLVDRMATLGLGQGREPDPERMASVRDALRQLTARIREAAMLCRVMDGQFVLAGDPVDRGLTRDDPLLGTLLQRCLTLAAGSITVRQGAAPSELLTLAQLLTQSTQPTPSGPATDAARREAFAGPPSRSDTPTTLSSVSAAPPPRELLRSWSVLVTPVDTPRDGDGSAAASGLEEADVNHMSFAGETPAVHAETGDQGGSPTALALTRLAGSHTDDTAMRAADAVIALLDDLEFRGDAQAIEGIARAVMAHGHQVGSGPGRLATERILRRLQHRRTLELLASRVPYSVDRLVLLELLARAGEIAVDVLVRQLMSAEDTQSRRAYFDSIVSLDLGGTMLFDLLRDSRWFVVRNAVALLGEMGVESADQAMLPLLAHEDDRIRIAVARALIRLGTAKAIAGLHNAIDDRHAEVRRIAAVSYGLSNSVSGGVRPPAARLAVAFEQETDEDAALEMLAALGKLGSADAIQRLLRIAVPSQNTEAGEKTVPREAWLRIAAIEALVKARGNAVRPAIEQLVNDPDPEVAAAAQRLRG
ncbi:MAG: HEAT repeat domain-containing protein [Gemmatimonadaceae bacterium]|nr:HEAT repeat domain-containing protein [Gemmatimonadaceae bacterium]